MSKVLVFAGSARRDSLNKKLARVAAQNARDAGGEVTYVDLDEYPIPLYHGDLEAKEGMPENAVKLRDLFIAQDGFIIASPENNSSVSSLLKNTIDWLSRDIGDGKGNNSGYAPFTGKTVAMMGASPGAFGTVRAMPHLRQILSALGANVLGRQVPVGGAHKVFDAEGAISDPKIAAAVKSLAEALVKAAGR
ncbi:NADPH-dependent FMN reductase [Usitatibacter palustris]|uniref:NAD(P)H-dependent FMN reductase n=1 Tax=Usitatibacter palustris TaxID=2732487 RepID=A0A6M4HC75_9PROT|nr:NAD(P)H-dependent oxidoreductase [Usitatibacter palustris]QJR16114.1 NAD(P)H-dependent FMN reductase [Usitatibacter palustris]